MKRHLLAAAVLLWQSWSLSAQDGILGFDRSRWEDQRSLEASFDQQLKEEDLRQWMKTLSAHPHHVGSPYDRKNAEFVASLFRSWGFRTRIETFKVLFPTPRKRLLEMLSPKPFRDSLVEPPLKEDATSSQQAEQLPTYNAYSVDGDVTAELVYVNYGVPADYEVLRQKGIEVRGRIVIARYGGSWRGIKPKVAAEHGAIGCILYSDPRDDGYFRGDTYPKGPYRSRQGAQRGSVADMPLYPGDPLTPGEGATENTSRLDLKEAPTLTKIPVLPISYGDALPLLEALQGPVAPEKWRGALPLTYHLGPGPARVHLDVAFNWDLAPAYDVIATLEGSSMPDQWIIRGNHQDAWVNGASDPVSGLVALLAEAKAIGSLAQQGWRPRRTILYAVWDAEEPGLIGSTEWVEAHARELAQNAALYINTDSNGRGFLRASGSHTLEHFINQVARAVQDPERKMSVAERARAFRAVRSRGEERREALRRPDLRIGALGSGSDYTPFLQHLGIASLNLGFGGESGGGSYHSIYDSFDHYIRFGDPGFHYGVALAQVCGRAVLRLAESDILPFEFSNFADTISRYVGEVKALAGQMRRQQRELNQLLKKGWLVAASDPTRTFIPPQVRAPVPHLNFAPLENALEDLKRSSRAFHQALMERQGQLLNLSQETRQSLDRLLYLSERALTDTEGLPGRSWYRHLIYAPGFYTGYGVKTLPMIREAIEQRSWEKREQASQETLDAGVDRTAEALRRISRQIRQAAAALRP